MGLSGLGGSCRGFEKRKVIMPEYAMEHDISMSLSLYSSRFLDGQNRQSPIASDFGSRTQIAALFAVLLYQNV